MSFFSFKTSVFLVYFIYVLSELINLREENTALKSTLQRNAVTIESKEIEIDRFQMELRLLRYIT